MKKRLLMLMTATILAFGMLTGCGDSDSGKGSDTKVEDGKSNKLFDKKGDDSKTGDEVSEGTLEAYYTQAGPKSQLDATMESMKEQNAATFSDIGYDVYGNTLSYYYQFKDDMSGTDFNAVGENLNSQMDTLIPSVKTESGVTDDIIIIYTYKNYDGTTLAEFTFYEDAPYDAYIADSTDNGGNGGNDTGITGNTLEDYYSQPGPKSSLDSTMENLKEQNAATFSDLGYEINGNEILYYYVFKTDMSGNDFDSVGANLESQSDSLIEGIKSESGVTDEITVIYRYINNDGSILGEFVFEG